MTNVLHGGIQSNSQRAQRMAPAIQANGLQWGPRAWTVGFILALFLLPVSLIPSSSGRLVPIPFVADLWWTEAMVIVFGVLLLCIRFAGFYGFRLYGPTKRWFLIPYLTLGLWQAISIFWNGRDAYMRTYSALETLCMCFGILGSVLLLSGLPRERLIAIGRLITLLILFIMMVYAGLSFVFPSWRPSAASGPMVTASLGFIRMFGPLGSATTLNFAIIPALGFAIGSVFDRGANRAFWAVVALLLLVAILGTGSRGGVLCLAAFIAVLMLVLRIRSVTVLIPIAMVLGMLVVVFGVPERFRDFRDRGREVTYATAWRAFTSSPQATSIGLGHGALYSRFHDDTQRRQLGKDRWYLLTYRTPYGDTLRGSHTAILRTLAETGIVGGILFLIPILWLVSNTFLGGRREASLASRLEGKACLAGCIGVVPYMALDEFFVGASWIMVLWVSFVVIGCEVIASNRALRTISPGESASRRLK